MKTLRNVYWPPLQTTFFDYNPVHIFSENIQKKFYGKKKQKRTRKRTKKRPRTLVATQGNMVEWPWFKQSNQLILHVIAS